MVDDFRFAEDREIRKRGEVLAELVKHLSSEEDEPLFVSDEATVFDISMESVEEIIERIRCGYGIVLSQNELRLPIWRLLDMLAQLRRE